MITKVSAYYKSPEAIQTNFNFIKNEPTRVVKETVKDNVKLSAEGIQKAEAGYEHVQKTKELLASKTFIDPGQQENIEKLIADLKAIIEKSEVTEEQKETLKKDLKSTLQGIQKPSEGTVDKFVTDLSETFSDGDIDPKEIILLQQDIYAILNSANISDEQIDVLKEDLQAIGESSNISKEDLETLWNNIVQVVETARKVNNL